MTGRGGRGKEKREGRRKKRKEEQALREPNVEKHGFGKEFLGSAAYSRYFG